MAPSQKPVLQSGQSQWGSCDQLYLSWFCVSVCLSLLGRQMAAILFCVLLVPCLIVLLFLVVSFSLTSLWPDCALCPAVSSVLSI
uniref:Uncharacterized protein n=1 Tax=Anguilla anguilla TaxID=7936 RepID=A0A0E9XB37_ANGAN